MIAHPWSRKRLARAAARPIRKPSTGCRFAVEPLEDRLVLSSFHVTSLIDDGGAGTLRDAILRANVNPGADAIDFQVSGTVSLSGSELPAIGDDLTITAPAAGLTIDAQGASRILEVNASVNVGLSGLTLVNGSADEGGGIFNGGTLSLTACTLSGNRARLAGGGIFNNGGRIWLQGVTLDSNAAAFTRPRNADPVQWVSGGALCNSGGAVTFSHSRVTNNVVEWVPGGAAGGECATAGGGVATWGGSLEVFDTWVTDNSALEVQHFRAEGGTAFGGGVFASGATTVTVVRSQILNNRALGADQANTYGGVYSSGLVQGGGVFAQSNGSVTLTDSVVSGNTALGGDGGFAYFTGVAGAGGAAQGGGLFLEANGAFSMSRTTLASNTAQGGRGGQGGPMYGLRSANGGTAEGGGMFLRTNGPATIKDSTLSGNTVQGGIPGDNGTALGGYAYGGGARVTGDLVTFTQCTIAGNTALGAADNYSSRARTSLGGGIYSSATVFLTNCTLAYGTAATGGGNFYNGVGAALNNTLVARSLSGGDVYGPGGLSGHSNLIQDPSNQPLVDGVDGNIIGHDPLLGAQSLHGGPTETIPLLPGSPALDVGDPGLAVEPPRDLLPVVSDPGFEAPSLGAGSYAYNPTGSPWTFSGSAGLTGNGSAFGLGVPAGNLTYTPAVPEGSQVALLQYDGSISQAVDLAAGTYALAFASAQRGGNQQTFQVQVDGAVVGTVTPKGVFATYVTDAFTVTAGTHKIEFAGLNPLGGDNTAFLDQIRLVVLTTNALTTDQRGVPFIRGAGAGVDIGAYERQSISPLTLVVNTTADGRPGTPGLLTLREAVELADNSPGSTITFDPAVFGIPQTIRLTLGELDVTADMTITGPGARLLTIDSSNVSRIFEIDDQTPAAIDVTISGLTLTGGNPHGGTGGAIDNAEDLTLIDSTVSGSTAAYGGGIFNFGNLNVTGSTISGNATANQGYFRTRDGAGGTKLIHNYGYGGGICSANGALTVTNSTIAGNSSGDSPDSIGLGGALFVGTRIFDSHSLATGTLTNCTITDNFTGGGYTAAVLAAGDMALNNTVIAGNPGGDYYQSYGSTGGSNNWIGGDPLFDPAGLQNNGGPTDTIALLPGSPLIDAGDSGLAVNAQGNPLPTDQRGANFARVYGATVDIGAFEVQPPNQPPTVAGDQAALTVNEGSPVTATGTFNDPQGRGSVTLTASLGTITQDNADGTWSWSYTPSDGPNSPTTVTIIATDDGGFAATTTFILTVNNAAPTASITGVPAAGHGPEGTAIALGSTVTDPSSADTAAGFTYAWSVTRNGAAFASGSSANFNFTPNDNGTYVVTLAATDKDGAASRQANATILVDNVAPAAGVSGPASGVRGQARAFTLAATDPSGVDQAAGFTFTVAWGDGSTQTVTGPSGTASSHIYTTSGTYTMRVTATDKDGAASVAATQAVAITAAALQVDPTDPSKTALVVGGTTGADTIAVKPADAAGTLEVTFGKTSLGTFKPTGHVIVYGQAGDDTIKLQTASIPRSGTVYVSVAAFLFGDDGNDTLNSSGSGVNNVLEGGAGNDNLQAGGGRDALVGGPGADVLHGGGGDDLIIGGTTDYDINLAALDALMAEWGRTDADYNTRVKHLSGTQSGGLNGGRLLTSRTVHDDAASDSLFGEDGADWFFALPSGTNKDLIKDLATSEKVTTP